MARIQAEAQKISDFRRKCEGSLTVMLESTIPIMKREEPLTQVSYYEAAALDFAGIRIKRHYKVGGGFNFIFEFIS